MSRTGLYREHHGCLTPSRAKVRAMPAHHSIFLGFSYSGWRLHIPPAWLHSRITKSHPRDMLLTYKSAYLEVGGKHGVFKDPSDTQSATQIMEIATLSPSLWPEPPGFPGEVATASDPFLRHQTRASRGHILPWSWGLSQNILDPSSSFFFF